MSEDIIWSGDVGPANSRYQAKIVRIGQSIFRGVLHILDDEGEELYQKEVPIAHGSAFGADAQVAAAWRRVIDDWLQNKR